MKPSVKKSRELNRMRPALGTFVEIRLRGAGTEAGLQAAATRGFEEIARVERRMSYHSPESDLSRLNRAPVGRWIRIHPWTSRVLKRSLELQKLSGGVFNVAVADVLFAGRRPALGAAPAFQVRGASARRIADLRIDLGGIAKGFAVDLAVRAIRRKFRGSGLVNAGGDLRAFGPEAAPIRIRIGHNGSIAAKTVLLREGAMASSYSLSDKVVTGKSSRLLRRRRTVSVFAPDCMSADALTKVVLMANRKTGEACLNRYGAFYEDAAKI